MDSFPFPSPHKCQFCQKLILSKGDETWWEKQLVRSPDDSEVEEDRIISKRVREWIWKEFRIGAAEENQKRLPMREKFQAATKRVGVGWAKHLKSKVLETGKEEEVSSRRKAPDWKNYPEQGPQYWDGWEGSKLDELSEEEEASKAKKSSEDTPQRRKIRSAAWSLRGINVFDCTVGEAERAAKEGCNLCTWIVGRGRYDPEDGRFIAASISHPKAYSLGILGRRPFEYDKYEMDILKELEIITLAG